MLFQRNSAIEIGFIALLLHKSVKALTFFFQLNSSVDNKKRSNVREESLLLGSLRRNGFGKRNDRMPKQRYNFAAV